MSIVNFNNVKITTMTAIAILDGEAIIDAIFPLLPITKIELAESSRSSKKLKIPWPGSNYAGSIFSIKYAGINRGIVRTSTSTSFRNSISMDICTSGKNISAKLSKNKIQMTGANSVNLAHECADHIVKHLTSIQSDLDHISKNPKRFQETVSWFIKETKGQKYVINEDSQEIVEMGPYEKYHNGTIVDSQGNVKYQYRESAFSWETGDKIDPDGVIVDKHGQPYYRNLTSRELSEGRQKFPLLQLDNNIKIRGQDSFPTDERGRPVRKVSRIPILAAEVVSVEYPKHVLESMEKTGEIGFPDWVDQKIGQFILKYVQDYVYHHLFVDFLENLGEIKHVYQPNGKGEIAIGDINIAMINYSYSLGMNVDRWKLAELINGYDKFKARYNNTVDHAVNITIPYERDTDETIKRKGNTTVTWMVYKSGIVTQSGPSPAVMEPLYYKFMSFINKHRKEIAINDGKTVKLKFTRSTTSY